MTTIAATLPTVANQEDAEPMVLQPKSPPASGEPPVAHDRHAPKKLSPDDPSLRLKKPLGLQILRKERVLGAIFVLAGISAVAIIFGNGNEAPPATAAEGEMGQIQPAENDNLSVPDVLQNAPNNSSPVQRAQSPAAATPTPEEDRIFAASAAGATSEGPPAPGSDGQTRPPSSARTEGNGAPPSAPSAQDAARALARQEEVAELQKAMAGPTTFNIQIPGLEGKSPEGQRPPSGGASLGQGLAAPPGLGQAGAGAPSVGAGDKDPNGQAEKAAFVRSNSERNPAYVAGSLTRPRSPYEVKAGSIIPAQLITGINSDLPGDIIGQVRQNVYDSVTGTYLLIPQGSKLMAKPDSSVAYGQERVLVCWTRLILPNGWSLDLECAPGADLAGQAGFADEVDNHWGRLILGVGMSSLLSVGTQASAGSVQGLQPTLPQVWAAGAARDINTVGQQFTQKNLTVQPTITIRPGFSVNVLVSKDLVLAPYPRS
jgi:type IV secretory pathway VirB10-like protein